MTIAIIIGGRKTSSTISGGQPEGNPSAPTPCSFLNKDIISGCAKQTPVPVQSRKKHIVRGQMRGLTVCTVRLHHASAMCSSSQLRVAGTEQENNMDENNYHNYSENDPSTKNSCSHQTSDCRCTSYEDGQDFADPTVLDVTILWFCAPGR